MFRVMMQFAGKPVRNFTFEKALVTIGRDATCDIVVDNIGASRRHAMIEQTQEGYVLADLRSNNGTFVDGERILHHRLADSDEFLIGKYAFRFESVDTVKEQETAPIFADVPEQQTVHLDASDVRKLRERSARRQVAAVAHLVQIAPEASRQKFRLEDAYHVIGKDRHATVRLAGMFVPRIAGVVVRTDAGHQLVATSRALRVNGQRLPAAPLQDGDLLECGRVRLRYVSA